MSLEDAASLGCRACGSPGGGCQFLGTAASSQVVCEALGMSLPHSALAPSGQPIWCSQRDIVQLIECCINAGEDVRFEIFYGMSDNKWRWVDIDNARRKVGYIPRDRAEGHG